MLLPQRAVSREVLKLSPARQVREQRKAALLPVTSSAQVALLESFQRTQGQWTPALYKSQLNKEREKIKWRVERAIRGMDSATQGAFILLQVYFILTINREIHL